MTEQSAPQAESAAPPPGATAEPPPLTAFAWRNDLVRPAQGRLLAGVCGAIGRATKTDPVLWRVLLAVLAIFGGVGVVIYLLGWLLLPADGDTASPVEALLGRGASATSAVLTVIGGVIVLMSFPVLVSEPFRPGPWGVILIGGALLLLLRDRRKGGARATPTGPLGQPTPYQTSTSGAPMASPTTPAAPATPYGPALPYPPAGPYPPAQPFAPHGPFGGPPPLGPTGPVVAPPPPPRPRQPRSRLGRLTFSVLLIVVGLLGLVDLAGYSVPGPSYFAAALAVVGFGLILGAWIGRARGLIALGLVLSVLTAGATVGNGLALPAGRAGEQTWVVTSLDQLQPSYEHSLGDATLDLSELDLSQATGPITVDVSINLGNLEVRVPPNADVTVDANVDVGNADIFDQSFNGLNPGARTVIDLGDDGAAGGGELHINASVDMGNLEVKR